MKTQRAFVLTVILIGIFAVSPIVILVLGGHTLQWGDTFRLYASLRGEVVEALRSLSLPLWNAYEGLGMPLFAQMIHGVLHPVSLLMAFVVPHASLDLTIIINIFLAACGGALLASSLGASLAGAAVSGFSFALSGYLLSMSANLVFLVSAATAPWVVASLLAAGVRGGGWIALAAGAVAAAWFAGDPQWAIVAIILGAAFAAEAAGWRALRRTLLAVIVGTMLAAVQLLPAHALLSDTMRSVGLSPEERLQWALPPWRLLELIAPGFFSGYPGIAVVSPVFGALGGEKQWFFIPFTASVYVGIIPILLSAIGARNGRKGVMLVVAAFLFLWLAFGTVLGADQLVRHLPVWGSFRYPEKLVGPFTLCIALLAGFGTDKAIDFARRWRLAIFAAVTAITIAALMRLSDGQWLPWEPLSPEAASAARSHLAEGLLHTGVAFALLAAILYLSHRRPVFRNSLPVLLAGLTFIMLSAAVPYAVHIGKSGQCDPALLRRLLPAGEFVRLMHPVEVMDGDGPAALDKTDRLEFMEASMAKASYNVLSHLDAYDVYTGLMPRRYMEVDVGLDYVFGDMRWQSIRRFACSHVVFPERRTKQMDKTVRMAIEGGTQIDVPASYGIHVWAVPHRPLAFFAGKVTAAETEDRARQLLVESVLALGNDVVVEGLLPGQRTGGRILSMQRSGGSLVIEGESEGPAVLVINDAWWPGWTAFMDDRPIVIRRADALVRAVEWPEGHHRLVMRYDPPELQRGLLLSLLGLLVTIALVILPAWRSSRARARLNL